MRVISLLHRSFGQIFRVNFFRLRMGDYIALGFKKIKSLLYSRYRAVEQIVGPVSAAKCRSDTNLKKRPRDGEPLATQR